MQAKRLSQRSSKTDHAIFFCLHQLHTTHPPPLFPRQKTTPSMPPSSPRNRRKSFYGVPPRSPLSRVFSESRDPSPDPAAHRFLLAAHRKNVKRSNDSELAKIHQRLSDLRTYYDIRAKATKAGFVGKGTSLKALRRRAKAAKARTKPSRIPVSRRSSSRLRRSKR